MQYRFLGDDDRTQLQQYRHEHDNKLMQLNKSLEDFEVNLAIKNSDVQVGDAVAWDHSGVERRGMLKYLRVVQNVKSGTEDDIQYTILSIKKDGSTGSDLTLYRSKTNLRKVVED